jgi:hypothetical protein
MMLMAAIPWTVFWFDVKEFAGEMGVPLSIVLSMVAFQLAVSRDLPRVAYVTFLDALVLYQLYLYLPVHYGSRHRLHPAFAQPPAQAVKLHRIARWAFPLAYFSLLVLLLVIYWPARQGTTEITAQPPSAKGTGRHQTSRGLDLRTRSEHPLRHSKNYVALERLLGCRNLDKAGGSARGHRGFDFSSGNTRELGRRAIKSDIGGAGQIVSQNRHGPPDLAGGRVCFDEGTKCHRQTEDVATSPTDNATAEVGTALDCKTVESPVGGLHQRGNREGTISAARGVSPDA